MLEQRRRRWANVMLQMLCKRFVFTGYMLWIVSSSFFTHFLASLFAFDKVKMI